MSDNNGVKKDLKLILQLDDVFTYSKPNEVEAIYNKLLSKKVFTTKVGNKYILYLRRMMEEKEEYQGACLICNNPPRDNSVFCNDCYEKSKKAVNKPDKVVEEKKETISPAEPDIKQSVSQNNRYELDKNSSGVSICPECGEKVDSCDKTCKNCGYPLKKTNFFPAVAVLFTTLIILAGLFAFSNFSGGNILDKLNYKKTQQKAEIENIKTEIETCNNAADYSGAVEWCEKLIETDGENDYSDELKALKFSRDNYECAKKFHDMIKKMDSDLRNDSYTSLVSLLNSAKSTVNEFDKIEPNTESDVGKYIDAIHNNPMYQNFRDEHINGTKESYDAPLVQGGFAYIIQTDTEILLEEKFVGEK